jgi:serine phosphatase RsbU (regulator of sigma subunit)
VVTFIRDITQRRLAEQDRRLLQVVSLAVGTAPDLDSALAAVLRAVCETTGWALGQAWLPSPDEMVLECSPAWYDATNLLRRFRSASERRRFRRGEGLPGRAWESAKPVWVDDISNSASAPRAADAQAAGVVAAAGFPVLAEGTVVAVIEFFLTQRRDEDERLLNLLAAITAQLGVAIQRKRGEQELLANAKEFRAARDIQERLFPEEPPRLPGFDIAGRSRAASAAGGDYFDFIPLLGDRLGVAVGDVTGHGIGPALLMAETRAYLRALAQTHREVHTLLTAANRVVAEDIGDERFITMLLVALDPATRTLTYVNAGHPPAYILDRTGEVRTQLVRSGVPLGIRPDAPFPPSDVVGLESGDTVLLFTDGIEEAMRHDDAMFGQERALKVIQDNLGQPAEVMVEALYRSVREFAGDAVQLDDATAVIIRVL